MTLPAVESLPTEPAVVVRGLVKQYPEVTAVAGVDLTITHGEVFALLGPNGAGKTTTVEIMEGYRRRTEGEVQVLGVDPQALGDRELRAWKARLGIVRQDGAGTGRATVRELLTLTASLYPNPRPVEEVINAVGLADKAKSQIPKLSGGQRRRLDVALAIVGNPELLFLDEPTTGFDPKARRAFWDLITALSQAGTTIILTTHYLDEAAHLADRAAVIDKGSILAMGPVDEIGGLEARTPLVRWREDGQAHEQRTMEPTRLIGELATTYGGEIPGLEVIRPSLEDVYLSLISSTGKEA
jgi:ABC-2 type transport system ATP-binding protein